MRFTKEMVDKLDLTNCDITLYRDDKVFAPTAEENNRWIFNYGKIIGWSKNDFTNKGTT